MKKVLAVSGGIDSMVMLHMFRNDDVLVAHFNHGIRENSDQDEDFVRREASRYGREFVSQKAHLGPGCSESAAREARYRFLQNTTKEYNGKLCVAHHQNDVIESIIINLLRGTGWRGLTPMYRLDVERPLINMSKHDIFAYASEKKISYREDPTNNLEDYLRNRVRFRLREIENSDPEKYQKVRDGLMELYSRQIFLRREIDSVENELIAGGQKQFPRAIFGVDELVALELLRAALDAQGISQTRPQLERALLAIKSYSNGKKYSLNRDRMLEIDKYYIRIK